MKRLILIMTMAIIAITSFAQGKSQKTPEDRAKRRSEEMQRITGINDEQKAKVYNLIIEKQKAAKDILAKHNNDRKAARPELKQVWTDYNTQIKTILTPDQYQKWVDHIKNKKGKTGKHKEDKEKNKDKVKDELLEEHLED